MKTEQEQYYEIMNQYHKELQFERDAENRINNRIFKAIERQLGADYLAEVKELLNSDCPCYGALSLVRTPVGDKQEFNEFDYVQEYWVDQTCNGGYTGDDFHGQIYISLKPSLFIKAYY